MSKVWGAYILGSYAHGSHYEEVWEAAKRPLGSQYKIGEIATLDSSQDPSFFEEVQQTLMPGLEMTWEQSLKGFFPLKERLEFLERLAKNIEDASENVAQILSREVGKPISLSRSEIERGKLTVLAALEAAPRVFQTRTFETAPIPAFKNLKVSSSRQASGPLLAVSPFNFPFNLVLHKLAPAFAAGIPVLLKPSPKSALTALLIADLCHSAGLPAGFLSVIPMSNVDFLKIARHPIFSMISFTGSSQVGWMLKKEFSEKRVFLELGGTAPVYIHKDADLSLAAAQCTLGAFNYAGQSCISVQKIYTHPTIREEFERLLKLEVEKYPWGLPENSAVYCSSVIDVAAAQRIHKNISESLNLGASILTEAPRPLDLEAKNLKTFVRPTVLKDVPESAPLGCDEIFGPVASLMEFKISPTESTEDVFIQKARAQTHRLQAYIFTQDRQIMAKIYQQIDFGNLVINRAAGTRFDPAPYGGAGLAGEGREGPEFAMKEMAPYRTLIES